MSLFKKAERKQAKLRLGLNGPSGSGKTYSALRIAVGISKKRIAVIDTEKGSASLYSDKFDFDTLELEPPFTHEKYIHAIEAAEKSGNYDLVLIDSLSHAWMGEGGVLDQKAILDQKSGSNQYANWKKPKENYTKLKNAIIFSTLHVICTLRAKQAYEQVQDENGRKKIEKMGMEPQTEPGAEYELTTVLDIAMNHYATASKDRTGLFDGKIFLPTEKTGEQIYEWLMSGKAVWTLSPYNMAMIKAAAETANLDGMKVLSLAGKKLELMSSEEEYNALLQKIRNSKPALPPEEMFQE